MSNRNKKNGNNNHGFLFEHAPTGFAYARIIVDKNGIPVNYKYLDINIAFEKMFGRKKEAVMGNALKFHRQNVAPVICITSQNQSDGNYQISVADNGIGFDEKYIERIFGVFQRLHSRSHYKGTGVGLAVCKKIAERHNGTITAQSKPENGATFIITLPSKQSH